MIYNFFDKKSSGVNISGGAVTRTNKSAVKSDFMSNQRPSDLACLAKGFDRPQKSAELHKPIIRKFEK